MRVQELCRYAEHFTRPLGLLYQNTGNCCISGYLGEELDKIVFDEEGKIHFETHKEIEEKEIDSFGVVLKDSVLIKQIQKTHDSKSYYLYSWDVNTNQYTMLVFDQQRALNRFYDLISRYQFNLCQEDVSLLFQQMGLTFENVIHVLLNQRRDFISTDFDDVEKGNATQK